MPEPAAGLHVMHNIDFQLQPRSAVNRGYEALTCLSACWRALAVALVE